MSGLLDRLGELFRSEQGRLVVCCCGASLLTLAAVTAVQSTSRSLKTADLRQQANEAAAFAREDDRTMAMSPVGAPLRRREPVDETLVREQLSRNYLFFGDDGVGRIRGAFVVVVGVGGVGSWATTMLVRSGVGRVRIVDFDQVTLSSLNRHACATLEDVGTAKVTCLQRYLHRVAPWVEIECRNELFRAEDAAELLQPWRPAGEGGRDEVAGQRPDFVIDAIDNIDTKADLLAYCHRNGIPVVASMGAGCKADPTKVLVNDISQSLEDPLSRAVRRHLRLRGVHAGVPTVFSVEKLGPGSAKLQAPNADLLGEDGDAGELGILPSFRAGILPVLGTMPAVFGLVLATHVLTTLGQYPVAYAQGKGRPNLYETSLADLSNQNRRLIGRGDPAGLGLFAEDLGCVIEEAAKGRSVLPPFLSKRLTVSQLDHDRPVGFDNLVVLTRSEAQKHEQNVLMPKKQLADYYDAEQIAAIDAYRPRLKELAQWRKFL